MKGKQSPVRSAENTCAHVTPQCPYFFITSFGHKCLKFQKTLQEPITGCTFRLQECLIADPVWRRWRKKFHGGKKQ